MNKYETIKIWKETLKKLRMIHALTGKSQIAILEELIDIKLREVQKKEVSTGGRKS